MASIGFDIRCLSMDGGGLLAKSGVESGEAKEEDDGGGGGEGTPEAEVNDGQNTNILSGFFSVCVRVLDFKGGADAGGEERAGGLSARIAEHLDAFFSIPRRWIHRLKFEEKNAPLPRVKRSLMLLSALSRE